MANSAMVPTITGSVGSTSDNSTQSDHTVRRPSGAKAPFAGRQLDTVGGMDGFMKALQEYQNSLPHLSQIPEG